MARLILVRISAILLYVSLVISEPAAAVKKREPAAVGQSVGPKLTEAELAEKRRELERAAELAVERAVEKAAERAVEKALSNGNSSTITVTTKEAYSNAKAVAEEQAAPGAESTLPDDPPQVAYDRQYGYEGGYKVDTSAEAEQLGISKESVNSSVENNEEAAASGEASEAADGSAEAAAGSAEHDSYEVSDVDDDEAEGGGDKAEGDAGKDFDIGFDTDFDIDISGISSLKGDFGLKNTKTISNSYSKPKDGFPPGHLDINPEEGATILEMYASDFGGSGWSSAKQDGWVRHRPLWDDNSQQQQNVGRRYFENFGEKNPQEAKAQGKKKSQKPEEERQQPQPSEHHHRRIKLIHKRMVDNLDMYGVPLTAHSIDSSAQAGLYQFLQKEIKLPVHKKQFGAKTPAPMKVYLTIPVPYVPSRGFQKRDEKDTINLQLPYNAVPESPKSFNDELTESESESIEDKSKSSEKSSLEKRNVRSHDNFNSGSHENQEASDIKLLRPSKVQTLSNKTVTNVESTIAPTVT
uniref:Uncharacterized protein n=1 Tax=Trichogramma kaykai TaxID=54128 RepID=A0ABD2W6G6_9HYME